MLSSDVKIPFTHQDVASCGAFDGESIIFENYDWYLIKYCDMEASHIRKLCGWYLVGYWKMPRGENGR